MTSYRPVRVGELIQSEIAALLLRDIKDPRLRMATISHVDMTPDLRHARVYISRLGTETEQQEAIDGFLHAAGFIRSQLGKRLRLRYTPELTFHLDTAIAHGVRISSLLHDLVPSHTPETEEGERLHD